MKKLFAAFTVIAAGLAGSQYLTIDEGLDAQGIPCKELQETLPKLSETEHTFFLSLSGALELPNHFAGMIIGEQGDGSYVVQSPKCEAIYSWYYTKAKEIEGRILYKIRPPIAFVNSIKEWCQAEAECAWLGGSASIVPDKDTASSLNELEKNWVSKATLPHRFFKDRIVHPVCSHGLLYSVGIGGTEPCDGAKTGWVPLEPGKSNAIAIALEEITSEEIAAVSIEAVR